MHLFAVLGLFMYQKKVRKMNKEIMIDRLEVAKAIVADIWIETNIDEVGDVLCAINEAIGAIGELEEKKNDA